MQFLFRRKSLVQPQCSGDTLGARDSYRAQYRDGEFDTPVNLGPGINGETDEGDIYVSPDETYIIHVAADRPPAELESLDDRKSFHPSDLCGRLAPSAALKTHFS